MDVAEHRHHSGFIESERTLLSLRPGSEVVSRFLIATDRGPEHVVRDGVAVQKINRCPLLYSDDVRHEQQSLLIDHRPVLRSGEGFARDHIDVNHRVTFHPSYFAFDIARECRHAQAAPSPISVHMRCVSFACSPFQLQIANVPYSPLENDLCVQIDRVIRAGIAACPVVIDRGAIEARVSGVLRSEQQILPGPIREVGDVAGSARVFR